MWKSFFSTMFNIIFWLGLQWYKTLSDRASLPATTKYNCKEDVFADQLLRVVLLQLGVRTLYYLLSTVYWLATDEPADIDSRTDFELVGEVVFFLQIKVWTWLANFFYPIIAFFQLVLYILQLLFLIYRLRR